MAIFVIFVSLFHAVFVFLACWTVPDPKAAFGHLMTDPMWTMDGEKAAYFGADKVGHLERGTGWKQPKEMGREPPRGLMEAPRRSDGSRTRTGWKPHPLNIGWVTPKIGWEPPKHRVGGRARI